MFYQFARNFSAEMNGSHKTILFYSFITLGILGWLRKQKIQQHSSLRCCGSHSSQGDWYKHIGNTTGYGNELQSLLMALTGTKHLCV